MEDNNFYEYLIGISLFIFAITNLLSVVNNTTNYIGAVGNQLEINNVVYEMQEYELKEQIVKAEYIIAILIDKLEYDIKINTMTLHKEDYDSSTFNYSLLKGYYSKSYELDQNGSVKSIVFKNTTPTHN